MTLELDARQRAMLEEMGVKVWWPVAAPEVVPVSVPMKAQPAVPAPSPTAQREVQAAPAMSAPASASATAPSIPVPVPSRTSPAPRSVKGPEPVPSAAGRSGVVFGAPQRLYLADGVIAPATGGWLVVADMPPQAGGDDAASPLAGDAGRLLDNMLRALQLQRGDRPVHLVRSRRPDLADDAQAAETTAVSIEQRIAALEPCVVLAMGPLAAQALLRSSEPLGRLRGRAQPLDAAGGPCVVATYPPSYLLRNPADKARAWADLCLAADAADAAVRDR